MDIATLRTVRASLRLATQALIKGWTRGFLAQDDIGNPREPSDSRATKFCAIGAIDRARSTLTLLRPAIFTLFMTIMIPR